jgi:geranylgeranyl pyrophosphate synthase
MPEVRQVSVRGALLDRRERLFTTVEAPFHSVQTREMGARSTLASLLAPIHPDLQRVASLLHELAAGLDEPARSEIQALLCRGKRLRPALTLLVGRLYGASLGPFHCLAAAVEALHTASLIHDDLLDSACERRGQATLHVSFSTKMAVLAGDYLLAQSMSLVADLENPCVWRVLAGALCSVCAGEIQQTLSAREMPCDRAHYIRRIEAKTASLCATAVASAAILAGAQDAHIDALFAYGRSLGVAFQIVDDVLDLVGDEALLGKPAGSDLRQGVVTLPVICYRERAADDAVVRAVLSGQRDGDHVGAAIQAICASGAVEDALAEARAHAWRAQEALSILPDNAARQTLHALADYVVDRQH